MAVLLCVLMLCTMIPSVSATTDGHYYNLSTYADMVRLVGRTVVTDDGIEPQTTASGIAFYTDAEKLSMVISGGQGYCKMFAHEYFIVYVDGVIADRWELKFNNSGVTGQDEFSLDEHLDGKMHRVEILRETEEINAVATYEKMIVDDDATVMPALEAPAMIEFIGDSITTGYGAYPTSAKTATLAVDDPIRQAGTKSYAYLTAQQLGMDIQVCCTSGYGVVCGYNWDSANLQQMYPYTAYHNDHESDGALWGFERTADIVVINLGTNDKGTYRSKGKTDKDMQAGIQAMMELAREKNPGADVVWVTGMMGIAFKTIVEDVIEELGGADEGYYFCELPKGTSGGGGHPDGEEHEAAAEVLTAFLKETVLDETYFEEQTTVEEMEKMIGVAKNLPGCDTKVAAAELRAAESNNFSAYGALTTSYQDLRKQAITSGLILGVSLVAVAAALVAFAVLYKPKKKSAGESAPETEEIKESAES